MERDDAYSVRHVARLLAVPEHRLRYWSQTGFISPSLREGARQFYSFRDLVELKVAKALLESGLPLRRVRRSLRALARRLPQTEHALASVRIRSEGDELVVEHAEGNFEAESGQLVLDFDLQRLRQEAAEVRALPWVADTTRTPSTAYGWFLRGCELESEWGGSPVDHEGFARAREAYETALQLDPELAAAATNLGSMYAELGELEQAREHFGAALEADGDQLEAHINLAELALREGDTSAAIDGYRNVLTRAPDHIEAHYGLARSLLDKGVTFEALGHLQRFCNGVAGLEHPEPELVERWEVATSVLKSLKSELARS